MKVSCIQNSVMFGRAFTSKEKKEYEKVQAEARKVLGLKKTTATIFDFSVPTTDSKYDTGIGTTFSDDAQKLAGMLKTMCGVNSIQLQPQGQISNYIRSPYSGTSFSLGMHIIDLTKLKNPEYGKLLDENDLKAPFISRNENHNYVDYDNIFENDNHKTMLKKAYVRFRNLDNNTQLKKDFEKFKKDNEYWLERDALFEAAVVENGSENIKEWTHLDQNVFATKDGNKTRIAELKQVEDSQGINIVDFEEFVQFIADKQQKESKEKFNAQGIDIYGDCQIGFSTKDFWAHKSAFHPTHEFGCALEGDRYACWSPALNFNKIYGEAGELLKNKFDLFFKRYNGVRIDAAWQLINPLICFPITYNGEYKYEDGNKMGIPLEHQPQIPFDGKHIIKDIILPIADKNNIPHDKIFLELLGGNSYNSLDAVKELGTTLIHITRYGSNSWGRVKYYESKGSNKYQNMKPGQYTIGPGTHDDLSLLEQIEDKKDRIGYLAADLHLDKSKLEHSPEEFSKAIWAELHTTSNQFATTPDILGERKRINVPNTQEGNWSYRTHQNYEEVYHTNLAKGKGLNTPDALSKAIKAKNGGKSTALTTILDKFAKILEQPGPMTTEEADKLKL